MAECVENERIRSDANADDGSEWFRSALPIGTTVELFGDKFFRGVVTAVMFEIGRPAQYRVEWRVSREINEKWMTLAEIQADGKLEE